MIDLRSTTNKEKITPMSPAKVWAEIFRAQSLKWLPKCNAKIKFPLIYHIGMCNLSFLGDLGAINIFLGVLR